MKKIIAIMMALVMMMAIAVPAFAANPIKETGEQTGESLVKTDITSVGAGSYTVTYPAEIVIPWESESYTATYTVTTQLAVGKTLNVAVADKTSTNLTGTMTATGTADTLSYTLSGDVSVDYDEVSNETENLIFKVADWKKTIAEYSGYVTFTATLADK